jgi:hypothetical protein
VPTVVDLGTRPAANAVPTVSVSRSRSGRWTIFEVEGEMDLQVVPLVADLSGLDGARVVFELHGVTFMDAGGLGAMMKAGAETFTRAAVCDWSRPRARYADS